MTLLTTRRLSVSYGGVRALTDADLEIGAGEIVGLIGPNGAGKTTCIDAMTGFTPSDGTVTLSGHDISVLAPHERARAGLARTWQAAELFDDLSVSENLAVAGAAGPLGDLVRRRSDPGREAAAALSVLERLGLLTLADARPEELSQGQRKLVGVGRALCGGPAVVLLDEPAAGLDGQESEAFGTHLRAVASDGPAMLLVDHDMRLVLSICDRVVVLDFGRVIASGTPAQVRTDPSVIAAYLGDDSAEESEVERA